MELKHGFVEGEGVCVEFTVESSVFDFWQRIKDYLQTSPLECCLTVKDWSAEHTGEMVTGRVQFSEQADSLTALLQHFKLSNERWDYLSMLELCVQIVLVCEQMEKVITDFSISLDQVFVTSERRVKLCLFTTTIGSLSTVLTAVAEIGFTPQDSELGAKLVSEMTEKLTAVSTGELCEWLKKVRLDAVITTLDRLNTALLGKMNAEAVLPLLSSALRYSLVSSCSFSQQCVFCGKVLTGDCDTLKYCSRHFACRQCCEGQKGVKCPKCPRVRIVRKDPVKETETSLKETVLNEGELDRLEFVCIECNVTVTMDNAGDRVSPFLLFLCRVHGLCNSTCHQRFADKHIPIDFDMYHCCLQCMKFEQKMAAKSPTQFERYLVPVQEAKEKIMEGGKSPELCVTVLDCFFEMMNSVNNRVEEEVSWPVSLSPGKLRSSLYNLRCIICRQNTFVHKRSAREMKWWVNRPFLVRCEFKLHAVCSDSCYAVLASSPTCPLCPQSVLYHGLVAARDETHIPTLEALRRTPGIACSHVNHSVDTYPLLTCAHEMCQDCIAQSTFDSQTDFITCNICGGISECELLLKRVLG